MVSGAAPLHLVAERLGLTLEGSHEATIGGHVLEALGRLPAEGETVAIDGRHTRVRAVANGLILELEFSPGGDG